MSINTLLIDGDMFAYSACAAVEKEVRWDDSNHVLISNLDEAWDAFNRALNTTALRIKPDGEYHLAIAFSGSNNFRKQVYPEYKLSRKSKRKPLCYSSLLDRIKDNYRCSSVDCLEGDDLLGIWATNGSHENPIIVSGDKDMMGVPGKLWRSDTLLEITEDQADYFWMYQTLIGDDTDGYPGLPGCGPKTAEKILGGKLVLKDQWEAVVAAYEKKGLTSDDALLMARCARILRATDWNSRDRKVILWNPEH